LPGKKRPGLWPTTANEHLTQRAAFAAAEAAAYDSCGLVKSIEALQAFSRASDALADALFTYTRAWEWAVSRE
jgi:hypothetical protein